MNANIDRLHQIGLKPSRLIIGLMSGTSLDGLDVALCRCSGAGRQTKIELLQFETVPYTDDFRGEIVPVFSKEQVDLRRLCLLNEWIAEQHAGMVNDCLRRWNLPLASIDLLASHGQTVYHAPKYLHGYPQFPNGSLQIGDGDHLAVRTGIITISDFRQKHLALGGEGAPLAVYGDYFIFSHPGENRVMLNIGGIANFTFLPGDGDSSRVFSTDTGPGNTLMDGFVRANSSSQHYDEDGLLAARGTINTALLASLKANDFFNRPAPKTTGPELFNTAYVERASLAAGIGDISVEDMMATLNRFTADSIVASLREAITGLADVVVYTSGGGMRNPVLMQNISEQMGGISFRTTEALMVNPDAKEAVLFAILANEAVAGGDTKIGSGSAAVRASSMGKISFPR
jgi:anhydro-N-acetylmuramic acid kinase